MAILAGPSSPMSSVVSAMVRSQRMDPFGDGSTVVEDPRAAVLRQIIVLLDRLTKMLDYMSRPGPRPQVDDFMRGWGEPGGSL